MPGKLPDKNGYQGPKNEKKYDTIEPAVICTSMYVIYYLACM